MLESPIRFVSNPFATRYVAPGRLDWCEREPGELDHLVERYAALGYRAQIIGPHGTGKTTLLHHLIPNLGVIVNRETAQFCSASRLNESINGITVNEVTWGLWLSLRSGKSRFRFLSLPLQCLRKGDLLILDGFEQLNWIQQRWVRLVTRLKGCGLLVTSHQCVGLPTLKRTDVTAELAERIVKNARLQATGDESLPGSVAAKDLQQLLNKHQGNMRECLMELYDLEEHHRPATQL